MKTKINGKLSLNKKTISDLHNLEMWEAKGGTLQRTEGGSDCVCTDTSWWYTYCDKNTCVPTKCYVIGEDNTGIPQTR